MKIIQPLYWLIFVLFMFNGKEIMAQESISRKDLLTAHIAGQTVSRIEVKEVTIPAGGKAAYHSHPCPVVGHIVSGTVLFQIEGQEQQLIKAGSAFYEPKDQPILHFDNASDTEPLIFITYYLLEDKEELIKILPKK